MNKQILNLHLPINQVSFGNVSILILRTIFDKIKNNKFNYDITLFPIGGNIDLSGQKITDDFKKWLNSIIIKGLETHVREIPTFRLWHLNGAMESLSYKQTLLTFYELDAPTPVELNIGRNNNLLFSSQYTRDVFQTFGVKSNYLPLAFDSYNFSKLDKKYHTDGRIVFNLCGKLEKRKNHGKIIKAWIKAFGNDRRYFLQCAIFNPFLTPEQNNELLKQIIGNEKPFNVSFLPNMKENYIYNDFLNSADIIIGMSMAKGWGLPEFQSVALGKYGVILNAHGYKGWANEQNSILVEPSGKEEIYDNIFFRKGDVFNQGNGFTYNDDEFINACKTAIVKVESNRLNVNGLDLQTVFNKENFVDNLISLSL